MIAEPVAPAWTPLCMEPDELAAWQEMRDRSTAYHDRTARPCRDCLTGFAAEMRAIGRCNGTPADFEEDPEMDAPATPTPPRSLPVARRVALDVAAPPCESCSHEPVCGLRAALEGVADVETTAPALPTGLTFSLTATVECAHFLRDRSKPAPVRVLTSQERGAVNHAAAVRASKPSTADWTPERRAAQGERMRARAEALRADREGAAAG